MLFRSITAFSLICCLLISGSAYANTILVWGDSLSAGYGLQAEEAWPSLMQTRLQDEGFPHRVVNGSVSGETSAGGLTRLPAALDTHQPSIVILELGANDGLRGLKTALLEDNLKRMIQAAQASGARVLLVGMQIPPNYGPLYTRRFVKVFPEVADDMDVALVPFLLDGFAERRDLFLEDGLHPNAAAQALIVNNVWPHLQPLLR